MLLFMILFCINFHPSLHQTFFYDYQEGDDKYVVDWEICKTDSNYIFVQSHSSKYVLSHTVECDSTFDTLTWEYEYNVTDTHYKGIRTGNIVNFKGVLEGEKVERTVALDPLPWMQFLGFSLARFAAMDIEKIKFNCIRPENLKQYVMVAKNQGKETIEINGIEYQTVRIHVTLNGLLSYLGGVTFWFRTSDQAFVKFEGLSLPWTSKIIYEIIDTSHILSGN